MAAKGVSAAIETYIPNYKRMNIWSEKTFCDNLAVFCERETSKFLLPIKFTVFLVKLRTIKSELISNFLIELLLRWRISDFVHGLPAHKIKSMLEISWL